MNIRITKGSVQDQITVRRPDGSAVQTSFPHKGPFPHDAMHFIVETQLRFRSAFWGRVFAGADPDQVGAIAKAGGHHSSVRSEQPDADIIQLLQAERLVECFEADLWSEPTEIATLRSVLSAACAQSRIGVPELGDDDIRAIREALSRLHTQWRELAPGESLTLCWNIS